MEVAKGSASRALKPCDVPTRRLLLRPLRGDDAPGMYAIYSDPETMRYWSSRPVNSLEGAARMVSEDLQLQLGETAAFWSITLPKTGRVIGKFALFAINRQHGRAELGYVLNRQFWGKGYGTECLAAMLETCFGRFGLHRLEADTDPENRASIALLEKFGFREEGRFRERWRQGEQWRDSVMLSLLAADWRLARTR